MSLIFPDLSPIVKKEPEAGNEGGTEDWGKIASQPPEAPVELVVDSVATGENAQVTTQSGGSMGECLNSCCLLIILTLASCEKRLEEQGYQGCGACTRCCQGHHWSLWPPQSGAGIRLCYLCSIQGWFPVHLRRFISINLSTGDCYCQSQDWIPQSMCRCAGEGLWEAHWGCSWENVLQRTTDVWNLNQSPFYLNTYSPAANSKLLGKHCSRWTRSLRFYISLIMCKTVKIFPGSLRICRRPLMTTRFVCKLSTHLGVDKDSRWCNKWWFTSKGVNCLWVTTSCWKLTSQQGTGQDIFHVW